MAGYSWSTLEPGDFLHPEGRPSPEYFSVAQACTILRCAAWRVWSPRRTCRSHRQTRRPTSSSWMPRQLMRQLSRSSGWAGSRNSLAQSRPFCLLVSPTWSTFGIRGTSTGSAFWQAPRIFWSADPRATFLKVIESPAFLGPLCCAMPHSSCDLGQGVPVKPGPGLFTVPGLAGSMQHGLVALFGCEPLSQWSCSLFDTIHCYIATVPCLMRPTCPKNRLKQWFPD